MDCSHAASAQKPCFQPTTDTFIQILDTHPKDGGLHWVTVATFENPVSGAVRLYDSGLALGVSTSIEMSVCNMLHSQDSSISIKLMNNDIHPNTDDYGVYAIAFAVSLAFCKEPEYLNYDNSKMRSHQVLLKCLHNGVRKRDSSPTGQFTDTHFEDSSPTELKTVHRQN